MATAVLEANESKLELVCDECDYYGSTDTIFTDNSTQTDGYDDDESELKPLKPRLSQIVEEETEMEEDMAKETEVEVKVETNGIRNDNDNNNASDGQPLIEASIREEDSKEDVEIVEESPVLEQVPNDSEDEQEIDEVARLTGLALGMGYARIIDYDNLRIIEHVIESDDDDDDNARGKETTSAELQQACHDLVTFIGESYQVIERSGHTRDPRPRCRWWTITTTIATATYRPGELVRPTPVRSLSKKIKKPAQVQRQRLRVQRLHPPAVP